MARRSSTSTASRSTDRRCSSAIRRSTYATARQGASSSTAAAPRVSSGSDMEVFWKAIVEGGGLLSTGDPYTDGIIGLSLRVSGISLLIAMLIGIPAGYLIGSRRFVARGLITAVVNTGMGLPPVVVGLIVYMFVSRSGPLAELWTSSFGGIMPRILYTVPA